MPEPRLLSARPEVAGTLGRAAPFLRPHRRVTGLGLLLGLGAGGCAASFAPLVGRAADALVARDERAFVVVAVTVLVVALVQAVLEQRAAVLLALAGERVVRDLRQRVVERLAVVDLRFLEAHRTGDLLRRTTVEIADLAAFLRDQLPEVVTVLTTLVLTLVVLVVTSPPLALLTVLTFLPPAWVLVRGFRRRAGDAQAERAEVDADVAATFAETVEAREALFTGDDVERRVDRIRRGGLRAVAATRRVVRAQYWIVALTVAEGLTLAALVAVGVMLVRHGTIGTGVVVTFVVAGRTLFAGFSDLTVLASEVVAARTGLARVSDLLETTREPAPAGPPTESPLLADDLAEGDLVLEGVTYRYGPGPAALRDVSLRIPHGTRLAIAGPSGAGKSTLAKVIAGLYRPDAGTVRHGGTDLAGLSSEQLRARVALVPQEVPLIDGTLGENIALAPGEPTREQIVRTVGALGLAEWLASLPEGLDTRVGPRGARLSAGERQLAGLIRASLADPSVLVLDEATAEIDPDTASLVEAALSGGPEPEAAQEGRVRRTVVVIAHRPATVERLPWVVTLEDGVLLG